MSHLILKLFFIPYRMISVIWVTTFMAASYLLFGRKRYSTGRFYQRLFERLGGTFIKVGQSLANRLDILPPAQCEALSDLLDEVKPFSASKGIRIIERELGAAIQDLFATFDPLPVASASFSQVYRATDHYGVELAIKVKRPYMAVTVFADSLFIRLMGEFAGLFPAGRKLNTSALSKEIVRILKDELNYELEADYIRIYQGIAEWIPHLKVPALFPEYSSPNILTMEFIRGISIRDILKWIRGEKEGEITDLNGDPLDLEKVGLNIYQIGMQSIFEMDFFHGDLHPGNILVLPEGEIALIDFGILGTLSPSQRAINLRYIRALSHGEIDEAARLFAREILISGPASGFEELEREMKILLSVWRNATADINSGLVRKSSGSVVNNSLNLARKYHFRVPPNVALYYKTIMLIDHINIELSPAYNSIDLAKTYIQQYYLRKLEREAENTASKWVANIGQLAENLNSFPENLFAFFTYFRQSKSAGSEKQPKAFSYRKFSSLVLLLLGGSLLILKFWLNESWISSISTGSTILFAVLLGLTAILLRREAK